MFYPTKRAEKPVLVIEDDDYARCALSEILACQGYEVIAASNGQAALNRLQSGIRPAVILLDLMMPIMDGWEFCRKYQEQGDEEPIPVVLMSGYCSDAEAEGFGVTDFVSKPLSVPSLLDVVQRHCRPV